MGPKKPKEVDSPNSWRKTIEEALLDEDTWKVKVVIIEAAGSDQDRIYLNKFEIFAAHEKRFVIKNICKSETIFMINQLGGDKKVKDENLRVFEEGQSYLKDKKDIPPDIQALIIKHLILKMKEEYLFIKKQRLEVKEGIRRESNTMVNRTEVRGTVNVKPAEPVEPPSPPPKNKRHKDGQDFGVPEPEEDKKYNTVLRVRGEEWRDKVYVDDYPIDGPNLYVVITGFMEPNLASNLIKIGIPLRAIIQLRIDPSTIKAPSSLSRVTKRGLSQTEILTEKSYKFWEDLQFLRINQDTADDFKNTAFLVFSPPYWNSETLTGNPDKIYDELSFLIYDIQDLTRQHLHYLDNMDLIHIPEDVSADMYVNYYHQQIDGLPLECVTTYSVLDSILQTVCNFDLLDEKISKYSLSTATSWIPRDKNPIPDKKLEKAEILVKEVFNTLCKAETNKKVYRLTYGEEYEEHKNPIIINYGDFAKYSTFHLGNIHLDSIIWSALSGMPLHKLWINQNKPQGELGAKVSFHINVLLSCFHRQDVETAELHRLLHILACRKLFNNRSSLKKKHLPSTSVSDFKKIYLKRSVLAEPLGRMASAQASVLLSLSSTAPSFPSMTKYEDISTSSYESDPETRRIKFLFDCPDISELVSAIEISKDMPVDHLIDDFEYFEDFSGVSSFQILLDAFNKFNCVDYKYCEVTDCFVLIFFNSHDSFGLACEEWRSHLATPLCLQDFFDFVLEQHYDWVQNEEKIYDEAMKVKSQSECKVIVGPSTLKSCIGDMEVDIDLLIEGSLKFQVIAGRMEPEVSREASDTQPLTSGQTTVSPASTPVDSKSSRKPKSPTTTTPRSRHQSIMASIGSETTIEIPPKPFFGYDLGDRRVEVFGKDTSFFSRDGTRVYTKYTLIIPMNIEYVIMNVVPGNSYNEFWIHRALGDTVTPKIIDSCESFRIVSKDQVMINIKKRTYEVPTTTNLSTETNISFESKTYHTLFVTWPNGLITESIHEKNSPMISHIKQYYISPMTKLDEYKRCISLNGEVIIFKISGDVEVLRPDGSFIKITKYVKKQLVPNVFDEISVISSDKSKKSKGKEKVKDKPSKTSSKSKYLHSDDSKEEQKTLEYELVIEEFECNETSGLRQKWVNDIPYTIEHLLTKTATDYCMNEVFSKRMDGTHILLNKDGHIVTFPDKTRIITKYIIEAEEIFPEWTDEEIEYYDIIGSNTMESMTPYKSRGSVSQSYTVSQASVASSARKVDIKELDIEEDKQPKTKIRTDGYVSVQVIYIIEHEHFTTVTINKSSEEILVESPNNTAVVIDLNNNYKIILNSVTKAFFDGENLHIKYEACPECQAFTTCDIKMNYDELRSVKKSHHKWLTMKDSFSKRIAVDQDGSINIIDDLLPVDVAYLPEEAVPGSDLMDSTDDRQSDRKSEISVTSHVKCRDIYLAKTVRFFVLRRDLTCTELVHRSLLDMYKRDCRWQPWCSINQYDTFGDQRSILSLLTPVHQTETEKWLMESKFAGKPTYLTYKDLKKDCGKGFYHWMRPYERFEPYSMRQQNVLPPRLPRAFILRTLEQQWKECDRDKYKGSKELIKAILQYRRVMEADTETLLHVPIRDPRPEAERRIDDVVQTLAHSIYEDLRFRLSEDVSSRAKPSITTKPPPQVQDTTVEGLEELEEESADEHKDLEEDRNQLLHKVEDAEGMSHNLARYWRRRAEEYNEEQFYKCLLREGKVPPYFHDVLGGAVWWDLNDAAGEAVTNVERRRMKCVCTDPEKTERPKMKCICLVEESQNEIVEPYM